MVFGFGSSPFLSDPRKYADKHYDYVIIGGGTAGSVLASRLTEDANISVCVLEAGGDPSGIIETKVPAAFGKLFKGANDWDYETEEEPEVGGRRMQLPRGKMLGGSSSMNAMMYQRCPPSDLDEWAERYGCKGWADADLRPYYKRSQKFSVHPQRPTIDLSHHSVDGDGTWQVGYSWLSKPGEAFIDACDANGVPANPDVNDGKHPIGATRFQTFIDQKGQRSSAFTAYLPPSVTSRSNLTIAINAHVTRILLEGAEPVATGAEFQTKRDGPRHRVYADKEVILCGGAYNSPQTMLLSGLGPAEEIKKHNIPLVKDMPDVGKNLYDHVCTSGLYGRTSSSTHSLDYLTSDLKSLPALVRWLVTGGGPMTTNVGEAAAFARMADYDPKVEDHGSLGFGPDLEFIHTPLCFRDHGATTTPAGHPGTISIAVIGLRPLSTGSVTLRSNSVFDKAVIRHNYWAEPNDRRVLIAGVRKGLEIFHNAAFDPYVDRSYVNDDEDSFYWPVSSSNYKAITDEQIIRWMHKNSFTLYHPVGSLRMGVDDKAVLDLQLRVRGVKNLRVCDASVMPQQIACHPTATIIAIAEKTADLLRGKIAVNDDATRHTSVGNGAPVAQASRL